MLLFLLAAAAIWGIGHFMGAPRPVRASMIALLYLGVVLAVWLLPADNPLRAALGATLTEWLLVGLFALVVWGYSIVLGKLRRRAHAKSGTKPKSLFSQTEMERYARHIVLRELGGPGQKQLKEARVLVVGAGGLGSPALLYLAAAGVGTIGVIDDDQVENSNLQRQVIHTDASIGMPKVFSAEAAMKAQNPAVHVRPYNRRLTEETAEALISDYDVVLDGTDNFETRYLVNRICVQQKKPLIGAALSQWEGQISTYDPANGAPCYQCIFPEAPALGLAPSCAEAGVLGPLPGVVGAMMAVEAIKVITGAGEDLRGRMQVYDALFGENRTITLKRRADCPTCGGDSAV